MKNDRPKTFPGKRDHEFGAPYLSEAAAKARAAAAERLRNPSTIGEYVEAWSFLNHLKLEVK